MAVESVPTQTKRGSAAALIAATLLSGLAAGALWCLLSIFIDSESAVVLIAFACLIGLFMRWQGYADRRGAIGAVVATLIAFVYAQYLFAAVRMANLLGFPLRDTLFRMDLPYAWRIVRDGVTPWDIGFALIACVVAVLATTFRRDADQRP
jgi:uncharacterized membrane protein YbjE (DUF340 family)